ncbi:hypothetical protein V1517DRAFT_254009 [Lipomyces orientalis]|uniref:Uncharacterized protein n=1 Tax=Lipomyces orientalis TaxID=1233043 RepID=A0ACC3TWF1_9ASCO
MKRSRPQASAKAFISAFKRSKQTPENPHTDVEDGNATANRTPTVSATGPRQNSKVDSVERSAAATPKQIETFSASETVSEEVDEDYQIQYISASDSNRSEGDYEILISDSEEERPLKASAKRSNVIDLDQSVQVSTFTPTGENLLETDSVSLFGISCGQKLAIQGQYSVRVIKGSIVICSANFTASKKFHNVFAPLTHAIPTIIADDSGPGIPKDTLRNELLDIIPAEFAPAGNGLLQFDVIIAIRCLYTGIENIEAVCQNLKNVWTGHDRPSKRSYTVLYRTPEPPVAIAPPEDWDILLRTISQRICDGVKSGGKKRFRPVVFICGAKSAGKSTFARLLTNALLTYTRLTPNKITSGPIEELVYLDLDPGQPEFGPSGTLSMNVLDSPMLGPSLTHATLSKSVKAFHFGYTTPRDAPQDYIRYVEKLMSYYTSDSFRLTDGNASQMEEFPLIINTPGWTKGQGVEVLRQLIEITKPNIIVYIGPRLAQPDLDTNFELAEALRAAATSATVSKLLPLDESGSKSPRYSAADLRAAQTMAYFHSTGSQSWDFSRPLTAWRPYVVRYSGGDDVGIHGIEILGHELILDEHSPAAINGTVVGISIASTDAALRVRRASTVDSCLPILDTPTIDADVDAISCLGLGVIRAMDPQSKTLYILTPIRPQTILDAVCSSNKVILSRGRLPLPIWAAWDGDQAGVARRPWREVPYLSVDEIIGAEVGATVGGQSLRVRRNVMRRSQQVRT